MIPTGRNILPVFQSRYLKSFLPNKYNIYIVYGCW
nr:MAG TPA: hypothetical protein [Caudoviricetes sp.]